MVDGRTKSHPGRKKDRAARVRRAPVRWRGKLIEWPDADRMFAEAYLRHRDVTRAFREAGLKAPYGMTEHKAADAFFRREHIEQFVKEKNAEIADRLSLSAERVLGELSKLGFANISRMLVQQSDGTAVLDPSLLQAEDWASISELTSEVYMDRADPDEPRPVKAIRVKLSPKTQALELLGKHFKLFTDRVELAGSVDVAGRINDARRKARIARGDAKKG